MNYLPKHFFVLNDLCGCAGRIAKRVYAVDGLDGIYCALVVRHAGGSADRGVHAHVVPRRHIVRSCEGRIAHKVRIVTVLIGGDKFGR